jgi:Na+-translocating ferredoxin:NAD+ oxidoreductase RnfD subunit
MPVNTPDTLPVNVHTPSDVPLRAGPLLTHSGLSISRFVGMHMTAALLPLVAGLLLFGWRALGAVLLVTGGAGIGAALWRNIGSRGSNLRYSHTLWMALLLAFTLPAHLLTDKHLYANESWITWPIYPAAGLLLAASIWLLGDVGSGRVHPVLITHLLLAAAFHPLLVPQSVLQSNRLFVGDVLDVGERTRPIVFADSWHLSPPIPGQDAVRVEPASSKLSVYTAGLQKPDRGFLTLDSFVRDRLPALEDFIVGGQPSPIGTGSAVAVIVGGLFLLYRGLIDYRIPVLVVACAFLAILLLPVPVMIEENREVWRWAAYQQPDVGWTMAVTFANYELFASPLLFMAFFLATSPAVRPMSRRARVLYATLIGLLSAVVQLYFSVAMGPYVALLLVSLLTPTFDRWLKPRTLL